MEDVPQTLAISGALVTAVAMLVKAWLSRDQRPRVPEGAVPCPTCGYDIRASPERCSECGALIPRFRRPLDPRKLRDDWPLTPIEPRKPAAHEMLVRIWDAPHAMAATLLVEQFRARGIVAKIQKRLVPMQLGGYVAPPSDFTVNVWSDDVEAAEEALERFTLAAQPPRLNSLSDDWDVVTSGLSVTSVPSSTPVR